MSAKLAGLVVTSLFAAFLVTAAMVGWSDANQEAQLQAERLTQTARVIASLSAESVAERDQAGSFRAVRSISQMSSLNYARLETSDGMLLAETGSGSKLVSDVRLQDNARPGLWSALSTGSLEASTPVVFEGQTVGRLTIFGETPELRSRILAALGSTLLGALAAMGVGLVVALNLANSISRPIKALAAKAREVQQGESYQPITGLEAEGEVGDLVAGLNDMMLGIQERDAAILEHVQTLENKVEERTAELATAKEAAESANAAKSDFLAVMSHEIRTPLNGILALSDLLARAELPARERRYAEVIAGSGQSLLSVINDILDFSKVEAGKLELEAADVDPAELLEGVAELFAGKAAEKGLDLAVFVDPAIQSMVGDAVRLRQVLSNLTNNAIKFTEAGGVAISLTHTTDGLLFEVRDTGPGIAEDKLPTLFEAFTQADQSTTRLHGGTGLGLAICDRLVKAMGGDWRLTSTLGVGSSFAFQVDLPVTVETLDKAPAGPALGLGNVGVMTRWALETYAASLGVATCEAEAASISFVGANDPVRPGDFVVAADSEGAGADALLKPLRRDQLLPMLAAVREGRRPSLARQQQAAVTGRVYPGVRVLVVDDSAVNLEVASEALTRLGVDVTTATDGQEAIDSTQVQAFDLVLMDGSMPGMDGFEATRRIRALEREAGSEPRLIYALTAHVIGSAADAWRQAGMDGVVAKPFTSAHLEAVLQRHFADRAQGQDKGGGAAQPVSAEPDDLFDAEVRAELRSMGGGSGAFVEKIEALYRTNAPLKMQEVEEAAAASDGDAMARAAHALKSMSLSLGAKAVARLAGAMEQAARGAAPPPRESVEALRSTLLRTLAAINGEPPANFAERSDGIAAELSAAIEACALSLVYQPLFDPNGVFANKVEALVRWRTAGGTRNPQEFVPELEKADAIRPLTDFVLAESLKAATDWPGVRVSVNAGAAEFQAADFLNRIKAALTEAGLTADRLEIEVTETAMISVDQAKATLLSLQEQGVAVALDDFGSGYTSLHALKDLPFSTLKIDKLFVDDCCDDARSAAIIHAVASVGRALGMKIVCEGVERPEQAEFLRIAGAHFLQGYLFNRPVEADQIAALTATLVRDVA